MAKKIEKKTFEEQFKQLEDLVLKMEQGGLSLEEMIKAYEEGMKVQKVLQTILEKTKGKLTVLKEIKGKEVEEPLEEEE